MQPLKIAIIQTNQFWENKEANFEHFEKTHFSQIEPKSCDLILLPEMFNTGFSMNTGELAEETNEKSIIWLKKWAQYFDCQIGATLMIKDQGNVYNRFVIISKDGIESSYNKRHLFRMAGENNHFSSGSVRVVHQLNGWRILLQVCYDLRFPVFSRNKLLNGQPEYDAVIYLANWPEKRSNVWSTLLKARAIENQAFCIGVNRVGTDGKEITYSGDSAVIDPWGNDLYNATKNKELVKILTLDYTLLHQIRTLFPALLDAD